MTSNPSRSACANVRALIASAASGSRVVKPEIPGGPQNVAAVEGGNAKIVHGDVNLLAQPVQADLSHDDPEQMFHLHLSAIAQAVSIEHVVDALQQTGFGLQAFVRRSHDAPSAT